MYHYRKTHKKYKAYNRADKDKDASRPDNYCSLCHNVAEENIVEENKTMRLVANRVSYDVFEGRGVLDHLMVIPKRHIELLQDFTDQENLDLMSFIAEYEGKGYNIYARGAGSITRSVKHQHTHLIKVENKRRTKLLFHLRKPYILINK